MGSGEYNLARTTKLVLATYWHQYSATLFLTVTVPEMGVQCPGPSLGLPTLRLGFRRREEEQAIPNYRFLFHPLDTITGGDITNTIVDHCDNYCDCDS